MTLIVLVYCFHISRVSSEGGKKSKNAANLYIFTMHCEFCALNEGSIFVFYLLSLDFEGFGFMK